MNLCYLSLGSNLNHPQRQLRSAYQALRGLPKTRVLKMARFYPNQAVGRKNQPLFFNTVIAITTTLPPTELLTRCLAIEKKQQRVRKIKWGARTLDIDILFYGQQVIKSKQLIIPHPRWQERDFVMKPLEEIKFLFKKD